MYSLREALPSELDIMLELAELVRLDGLVPCRDNLSHELQTGLPSVERVEGVGHVPVAACPAGAAHERPRSAYVPGSGCAWTVPLTCLLAIIPCFVGSLPGAR